MTFDEAMAPLYDYVDRLTDEQRDRVLTATDFINGAWFDGEGGGCLVGHASGAVEFHQRTRRTGDALDMTRCTDHGCVPTHFDHACEAFGVERTVAAIKAHIAAASVRSSDVECPAAQLADMLEEVGQ